MWGPRIEQEVCGENDRNQNHSSKQCKTVQQWELEQNSEPAVDLYEKLERTQL